MYETLPSYGEATDRDYWSIIASFVRSADLCAAALVCRKWNEIFSPLLWGNPASHFGTENDAVYVALVRFKRTLRWARLTTRELTHTLHLPPAQAEIYDGPRSEWLSDILHRLPRLQSLVVFDLPFFDHRALSSLSRLSQPGPSRGAIWNTYQLRLLDASSCNNLTPQALAAALKLFPALTYLNLSQTTSARYPDVLSSFAFLPALQILKVQQLWLNDDDLLILSRSVGRKLRCLDIRRNRISDRAIPALIRNCINTSPSRPSGYQSPSRPETKLQRILDSDSQDEFVRTQLTTGFTSYLPIDDIARGGITHLYISNNDITTAGASGLIRCNQLRVLDLGDLTTETLQTPLSTNTYSSSIVDLPRAETLIPTIEDHSEKLTYLRINHAVVTELISLKEAKAFEMDDTSDAAQKRDIVELESVEPQLTGPQSIENPRYELPEDHLNELQGDVPVCAELEGSPVQSPPKANREPFPQIQVSRIFPTLDLVLDPMSALSPTVDSTGGLFSPISPLSPSMPSGINRDEERTTKCLSISTELPELQIPVPGLEVDHRTNGDGSLKPVQPHRRTYSGVLNEHDARLRYKQSQDHALLPGTVSQLRTLVLTDVPMKSSTASTAQRIIEFIRECSDEERWSALQASVGYQLPPGPDRRSAERHYAKSLFGLRKLVLEMAPERQDSGSQTGWHHPTSSQHTLSSTSDADCETYLNAAKADFSFFGSSECGQPDTEGLAPIPMAAFKEKMTLTPGRENGPSGNETNMGFQQPTYDVLAEVSKFRKAKKMEHEAAMAAGSSDPVHGYWSGVIEVIRPRGRHD